MLKLSASSLLLHSSGKVLSWGFRFQHTSNALKAECPSRISGFRVHSKRLPFRAKNQAGSVCSAPTDRWGKLACHFSSRKAVYRSGWVTLPRVPAIPLTVHITTRSLRKDGGPEGELEKPSSSKQASPAKRSVRTIKATISSSSRKIQQRATQEDESPSAGKPKRVSVKEAKTQVPRAKDEKSRNEARARASPSSRVVNSSSKEFGRKSVVVENDIPKSNIPRPISELPKAPNSVKRSRNSAEATASVTVDSNLRGPSSALSKIRNSVKSSRFSATSDSDLLTPSGELCKESTFVKSSRISTSATGPIAVDSDLPWFSGELSKPPDSVQISRFRAKGSASTTIDSDLSPDLVESKFASTGFSAMNSNQKSNRRNQPADDSKPKQQGERRPRKKDFPVEAMLRRELNMCSKDGDVLRALDIYEKSVADGVVKWNQYNFNILLYLCSSAALGTLTARKSGTDRPDAERLNLKSTGLNSDGAFAVESTNGVEQQDRASNGEAVVNEGPTSVPVVVSPEVMEMAAQRGFEIFEDMKKQEVPPNEATLTAVARLAIRKEDGDLAFQMVKEMAAQNIAPKLRSYSPALVTFCKSKAVEKAFEVDAHMVAAGVQPEEPELGALLQLCVDLGLKKEVYSLLHRLRARVRALSPTTISSIQEFFSGQAGQSAGQGDKEPDISAIHQAMVAGGGGWHGLGWLGKGKWKLEWTTIDSEGFCRACKNKLVTIDLDPKETDTFAQSVAELAFARETKSQDFRRFQDWLERHGPFDAIIDGANVGLYNQNFQLGGFNFFQLNSVAQTALDRGLVRKPPLIILHQARTKFGAANSPLGQQLIKKWSSSNTLYTTPNGSNDDWYWMYAAVRNQCLLITNDEMRDHLFQLLGSDFFPKWKERHQVRFSATTRGPEFHLPPPYSLVIQECENGSWHIPKAGGNDVDAPHEWICVTRPGLALDSASSPVSDLVTPPATKDTRQIPHDSVVENEQTVTSPELYSPESRSRGKRSRAKSPPSPAKKVKAAEKNSASGPVTLDL